MRRKPVVRFILVAAVVLSFAGVSLADEEREEKPRFKGVELYSWETDGNKWVFVLLDGTNRVKPTDLIKKAKNQIQGVDSLKQALRKLAKNEQVSWRHRAKGFEFPPKATLKEIATAAKKAEVKLSIAGRDK